MPRITAQDSIYKVPRPTPVVAECPKCGNVCEDSSISVSLEQTYDIQGKRWIDTRRTIRATISTTFVKLPINAKCLCYRNDEHLHQKCFVCGFYWSTDTMDNFFETNAGKIDSSNV